MDDGNQSESVSSGPPRAAAVLLAAIAMLGLLIIALSFAPWVRFENDTGTFLDVAPLSITVTGTEIGRLVGDDYSQPADVADQLTDPCSCRADAGDGYITALFGAIVTTCAIVGLVWTPRIRAATLVAAVASLGALAVAGHNAMTQWRAVGAPNLESPFVQLSGEITPWLYGLTALAALSAVMCGIVWALNMPKRTLEDDMIEEEAITEGLNGWA